MTTALITVTIFDDFARMAYSTYTAGAIDPWSATISSVIATADTWRAVLACGADACRISVIDRRPGTIATSRSHGRSLTGRE